jgi:MOSC domain-containing protein YiiM
MNASLVGRIAAIKLAEQREQPVREVTCAMAIAGRGLEGCRHAKRAAGHKRQVLLVDEASVTRLNLPAGTLKENFLVAGLELDTLMPGQRLALGAEVVIELSEGCVPCRKLDNVRPGLMKASWGYRGQLARIIVGGEVRAGDVVRVLDINPDAKRTVYPKLPG